MDNFIQAEFWIGMKGKRFWISWEKLFEKLNKALAIEGKPLNYGHVASVEDAQHLFLFLKTVSHNIPKTGMLYAFKNDWQYGRCEFLVLDDSLPPKPQGEEWQAERIEL